jgi:L-alanine-DL-glutamate epimerase-like enolase superfamily enzyme
VRITSVKTVLHDRRTDTLDVFGIEDGRLPMGVLVLATDEGIEGHCTLSYPGPGPEAIARQIRQFLAPILIGADPLEIGRLWHRMQAAGRWYADPIAIGSVDIALWDIAGKAAGLPVHTLLGTCRQTVPVYFSSGSHPSAEAYADEAVYWREQGWKAYKLHPPTSPFRRPGVTIDHDIAACAAVRAAVGDEMTLMLDSSWCYSYPEALRVGRAIEELGFVWYEDPLPADDIHGYVRLQQSLSIPLMATEITKGGLYTLPQWIVSGATDYLRGDVVIKGGITGMMKIAHLAEAFAMNCEVHSGYNASGNLANLHVTTAIDNCDWYEVITFNRSGHHELDHLDYGLVESFHIDGDGLLHAPTRPGLGIDIDWDLINSAPAGVVE